MLLVESVKYFAILKNKYLVLDFGDMDAMLYILPAPHIKFSQQMPAGLQAGKLLLIP